MALGVDLKRAVFSRAFLIAVIGTAIAGFLGCFNLMFAAIGGDLTEAAGPIPIQLAYAAVSSDILVMTAPIFCTLPFTAAFVEEFKTKYVRFSLPRSGRKAYLMGKTLSSSISGGTALFCGVMLLLAIYGLAFTTYQGPEYGIGIDPALMVTFPRFLQKAFLFFLFGAFWALVGAIVATAGMNKYLSYACPFVIYFVLVILKERYFRQIMYLNPQSWLSPGPGKYIAMLLLLLVLTSLAGIGYMALMKRRLRNV